MSQGWVLEAAGLLPSSFPLLIGGLRAGAEAQRSLALHPNANAERTGASHGRLLPLPWRRQEEEEAAGEASDPARLR